MAPACCPSLSLVIPWVVIYLVLPGPCLLPLLITTLQIVLWGPSSTPGPFSSSGVHTDVPSCTQPPHTYRSEMLPGSSQWLVQVIHIDHWSESVGLLGKRNSNAEDMHLELLRVALPLHGKEWGHPWQIWSQHKETQNQGTSSCAWADISLDISVKFPF